MNKNESVFGWAHPINSKKFHIFVEGRALCNKWMFFGETDPVKPDAQLTNTDCKECFKRYQKHLDK